MYDRFTDRARKVLQLATQEAWRRGHDHLDSGAILVGMLKEGSGNGAKLLRQYGINLGDVRTILAERKPDGDANVTGKLPQTECAKSAIRGAIDAALSLKHNWVGTEHLLIGLAAAEGSEAGHVLGLRGVSAHRLMAVVEEMMRPAGEKPRAYKLITDKPLSAERRTAILKCWKDAWQHITDKIPPLFVCEGGIDIQPLDPSDVAAIRELNHDAPLFARVSDLAEQQNAYAQQWADAFAKMEEPQPTLGDGSVCSCGGPKEPSACVCARCWDVAASERLGYSSVLQTYRTAEPPKDAEPQPIKFREFL